MPNIVILGVFVADVAFRAPRQPKIGETLIGGGFALGPGGKGSNQAVAAARLGADVAFLTRLGSDDFGRMASDLWKRERIRSIASKDSGSFTGAAYIFVDEATGDNAIIVVPGAGGNLTPADIDAARRDIESAALFMTQLEVPVETAHHGLRIARGAGVKTILNPAPAATLDDSVLSLCDFFTPNESEAAQLTGIDIRSAQDASRAAVELHRRGAGTVIITLGENGAYYYDGARGEHIRPVRYGEAVETTGAGDSFCGAFACAVAGGRGAFPAARFACAAASISVTRPGTAPSMPSLAEVNEFCARLDI